MFGRRSGHKGGPHLNANNDIELEDGREEEERAEHLPSFVTEIDEEDSPETNKNKFFNFDVRTMSMIMREDETIGSMLKKSFWQMNILFTILLFVSLILAIIGMNASDRKIPNLAQESLMGKKIKTSLSIISPQSRDASLNFRVGEENVKVLKLALDNGGDFSIAQSWLQSDIDSNPSLVLDNNGKAHLSKGVEITGSLQAHSIMTTGEGISFPDGTKMTSAAKVLAGLASDNDLNLGAGVEDSAGSIVFEVDKIERARITKTGTHFRHFDEAEDPLTKGISIYPSKRMISISDGVSAELDVWGGGLAVDSGAGVLETLSSGMFLNSSQNPFTVQSSKVLQIYSGSDTNDDGSHMEIKAGDGIVGGDVVINGGGGSDEHGDIKIGLIHTNSLQMGSNKALLQLDASTLTVTSLQTRINATKNLHLGNPIAETVILEGSDVTVGNTASSLSLNGKALRIEADKILVGHALKVDKTNVHIGENSEYNVTIKGNISLGGFHVFEDKPSSFVYSTHLSFENASMLLSNGTRSSNFTYDNLLRNSKPAESSLWVQPSCSVCIDFAGQTNTFVSASLLIEDASLEMFDEQGAYVENVEAVLKCFAIDQDGAQLIKLSTFYSQTLYQSGLGVSLSGQRHFMVDGAVSLSVQCAVENWEVKANGERILLAETFPIIALHRNDLSNTGNTTTTTSQPTFAPSFQPSSLRPTTTAPTERPSQSPTRFPTQQPSQSPTTLAPTEQPSPLPTRFPTEHPSLQPTILPTSHPTCTLPITEVRFHAHRISLSIMIL